MAADTNTGNETDCDATPVRSLRKKHSRFFRRKADKMTPPATPTSHLSQEVRSLHSSRAIDTVEAMSPSPTPEFVNIEANMPPLSVPIYTWSRSPKKTVAGKKSAPNKQAELLIRKKPSIASLHEPGTRISNAGHTDDDSPTPPVPQIPVAPLTPQAHRPVIRSLLSPHSKHSTPSSTPRPTISAPIPTTQLSQLPSNMNTPKFPFTKPAGPPPPRPPRPESVDHELLALLRDNSTRMVLLTTNRTSTSTASTEPSTPSTVPLPSGHSSLSIPRSPISPLAANFPFDSKRPLPIRDSNGSVLGFGRFSAWVREGGGYEDGVEFEDREVGPVEVYRKEKCADWALVKRASGQRGQRGMVFKDRWGGLHFVLDV